ncbi:helix-turn-helix domain-containing protein [Pontixanthobacter aestiaquae]|uniref:Helix-turn-helix domain-containing protein n=1 Tax=Pontixanthobacter aestiaquae TaxID=1509367 RepID=A0A844Z601_9SPHN|nr:helix-turn-helix domain-containing protein [Pontixanthobacter aestiaquae]MDN3645777.1 helix-turn-helix domain-containing protein [Pontixanthobacter aestiaquae]MXO83228.1 helix-turn-helix domain-containing protein [Pontixanthobacter aestiaquae]
MRTTQAAQYLDVSESLLEKFRVFGGGPRYAKIGRSVIYRRASLDDWLVASEIRNTSDHMEVA